MKSVQLRTGEEFAAAANDDSFFFDATPTVGGVKRESEEVLSAVTQGLEVGRTRVRI